MEPDEQQQQAVFQSVANDWISVNGYSFNQQQEPQPGPSGLSSSSSYNQNDGINRSESGDDEPSTSTSPNQSKSIYRGLYPINEVKQFFQKLNVNGEKIYRCLWNGCRFETKKYSQHISRHIFLKHIGIRKLICPVKGCGKLFKRPESLVQHQKNHSCGFGITTETSQDPDNACGVQNIRKYFEKMLDNDMHVYRCRWTSCKFVTHNSGSIRRHVHNQHVCPFSGQANNNNNNGNHNGHNRSRFNVENSSDSRMQEQQNEFSDGSPPVDVQVEVQLNECDGETYDAVEKRIIRDDDHQMDHHDHDDQDDEEDDDDDDDEENINGLLSTSSDHEIDDSVVPEKHGIYSLKQFNGKFRKEPGQDGKQEFVCNQCGFRSIGQITFVRHLWDESDKKSFQCDECPLKFNTESALYQHRKNQHRMMATTNNNNTSSPQPEIITAAPPLMPIDTESITRQIASHMNNSGEEFFKYLMDLQHQSINSASGLIGNPETRSLYRSISDTNGNIFQCNICGNFAARNLQSMKRHLLNRHNLQSVSPKSDPFGSLSSETIINNNNIVEENDDTGDDDDVDDIMKDEEMKLTKGNRDKNGLYSLKKYKGHWEREPSPNGGTRYVCTKCIVEKYATTSQASMVRHIWGHYPQQFKCPFCNIICENEFALYKHKKSKHPEKTSQHNRTKSASRKTAPSTSRISGPSPINQSPVNSLQILNNQDFMTKLQQNLIQEQIKPFPMYLNGAPPPLPPQEDPLPLVVGGRRRLTDDDNDDGDEDQSSPIIPPQMATSRRSRQFKRYRYDGSPYPQHSDSDTEKTLKIDDDQNNDDNDSFSDDNRF